MTQIKGAPSRNVAGNYSLASLIRLAIEKSAANTDDMLPAKVISYNRATNRATVQPVIQVVTTANQRLSRGVLASVPVLQLGGGGFVLSFPLAAGDLGWIKASDRDISLFLQSYNENPPNTQRKHSFEDALFIPDNMMRGVTLADNAGVCLQAVDGSASIVLVGDEVKIASDTKITMTAPEIVLDSANIDAGGIRFDTHEHTGVQTGGGQTGSPTNP